MLIHDLTYINVPFFTAAIATVTSLGTSFYCCTEPGSKERNKVHESFRRALKKARTIEELTLLESVRYSDPVLRRKLERKIRFLKKQS